MLACSEQTPLLSPRRIYSWRRLERLLAVPRKQVQDIAGRAARYYRPFDLRKPSGALRHIDAPIEPLVRIQRRIAAEVRGHAVQHNDEHVLRRLDRRRARTHAARLGDVDADGSLDVVVSSPGEDAKGSDTGLRAYLSAGQAW